jgi:hypothetical protein
MLIYAIVWQILVFALFIAVMFDAYRRIVIAEGDANKEKFETKKELLNLLLWLLSWLPEQMH